MMSWTFRAALCGAVLCSMLLVASCDDQLAPPDGVACTVGTLTPGDSVARNLGSGSCQVWSDYSFQNSIAQSWTINAKAHHAYVVTFHHAADANNVDHIGADLYLYARNAAGDAAWQTGRWTSFGLANTAGAYDQELIFATSKAGEVSIRVEAWSPSDTGTYTISLATCDLVPVADGATSAPVDVGSACPTQGELSGAIPTRTAFWSFWSDPDHAPEVTFTRTAGSATFGSWVTGEGLDFGCYTANCTYEDGSPSAGPVTLFPTIYMPGEFVASATIHADSAATLTVGLVNGPVPSPHPIFPGPARAGRTH